MREIVLGDGHSHGRLAIRSGIARRWALSEADRVMVTHGSSEAIFLLLNTLLRRNDEVIVLDPIYHSLRSIPEALGCKVKCWELYPEQNFNINIDVGLKMINPNTRLMILNSPHNPTGSTIDDTSLQKLSAYLASNGSWLVLDNSFSDLHWSRPPFVMTTPTGDHVIQLGTLSKGFGLPGLRLGWCIANHKVISQMTPLKDAVSLFTSPLIEMIAVAAIHGAEKLLKNRREQATKNLETLLMWAELHDDIIELVPPQGGVTVFPKIHTDKNIDIFCNMLLEKYETLIVPGSCFSRSKHIRLGFGGNPILFKEGLDRLSRAMKRFF